MCRQRATDRLASSDVNKGQSRRGHTKHKRPPRKMVGVCPGSGLEQTYKDRVRIGDHQPVLVMHPIILNCNNVANFGHLTNNLDAHQTALLLICYTIALRREFWQRPDNVKIACGDGACDSRNICHIGMYRLIDATRQVRGKKTQGKKHHERITNPYGSSCVPGPAFT